MPSLEGKSFLLEVQLLKERVPSFEEYPYSLPAVRGLRRLKLHPAVTFLVGENGSGKSTLLEAIAIAALIRFQPRLVDKGRPDHTLPVGCRSTSGEAMHVRFQPVLPIAAILSVACSSSKPETGVRPPARRVVRETVTVKDPELERRLAEVELRLLEREAQVEELKARLDDTRGEVVRTMAKLQTVASRAEAASGMAEAEIALQALKASSGQSTTEVSEVTRLVRESTAEFNKANYGGALYLAGQAKALAGVSRGRVSQAGSARNGETLFAAPVRLKSTGRGNVREGPGTNFSVAFSLDGGTPLTGHSYADEWIRVSDDNGRSGWIFRSLVTRR